MRDGPKTTLRSRTLALKNETLALFFAVKDARVLWHANALSAIVVAYALSPTRLSTNPSAHRVEKMARMLGVRRGGYYAWVDSGTSAHEVQNTELVACIGKIQKKVKDRYGSPRIAREL